MANHISCGNGVSYRSAVQNPSLKSGTEGILGNRGSAKIDDVSCSMLAVTEGLGVCWSECSWSHVNPTRHTIVNMTTRQAKYMVRSVSWWTWTALASAWWSRPLLCPEVWLPSALRGQGETESAAFNAARGSAPTATSGPCTRHPGTRLTRGGQGAGVWVSRLQPPGPHHFPL